MSDQNMDFDKDLMDQFMKNQSPEANKEEQVQEVNANPTDKKEDVHTNIEEPEKPIEDPKENLTEEPKQEEKVVDVEFDLSTFNKTFEKEFENVDQIKELLSSDLKAQLDEKDRILAEKEAAIQEGFNPMNYFANEKQFKLNQILKANEGLNENIVNRVVNSNLDELNDEDVLLLNDLIKTKGSYDERIVRLDIKDRYGLNVDKENLEDDELQTFQVKEYRLKKDAEIAREDLRKMTEIELPTFKDPSELAEERKADIEREFNESKESWQQFTDSYVEKLDKLSISYDQDSKVDFDIDSKFKEALKTKLPEYAALLGKDVKNKNDIASIVEQVEKDYLWMNRGNFVKSIISDVETKKNQETIDKYENPSKPKSSEAPIQLSDEERHNEKEMQRMYKDFNLSK